MQTPAFKPLEKSLDDEQADDATHAIKSLISSSLSQYEINPELDHVLFLSSHAWNLVLIALD